MGSSTLEQIPDGARVFVDANIFIYHFTGTSAQCRRLLERCEAAELAGVTSVVVLAEVAHRLMMLEAIQRALITPGNVSKKLSARPEVVQQLTGYQDQLERIPYFNVDIRAVDLGQLLRASDVRRAYGLMVNDSLVVASAHAAGVESIVSADAGFDAVEGLIRYRPTDLRRV